MKSFFYYYIRLTTFHNKFQFKALSCIISMDKNIIDKYEIWKSCIENGDFYFISDEDYDEFTKIYENEVKIQEILTIKQEDVVENEFHIEDFLTIQQEDVVENDLHNEEFIDRYNILEEKPTVHILAYCSWIMAICVILGITTSNITLFSQEDIDTVSDVTKIHEKYDEYYEFNDFNWLFF